MKTVKNYISEWFNRRRNSKMDKFEERLKRESLSVIKYSDIDGVPVITIYGVTVFVINNTDSSYPNISLSDSKHIISVMRDNLVKREMEKKGHEMW